MWLELVPKARSFSCSIYKYQLGAIRIVQHDFQVLLLRWEMVLEETNF